MSKGQLDICSQKCGSLCCREVSRLPYMGERYEVLFSHLFIGALPDIEKPTPNRLPFVVEWQVPQEIQHCPALGADGLCTIYDHRPIACRRFPLIDGGGVHPFCRYGNPSMGIDLHGEEDFLRKKSAIDMAILKYVAKDNVHAISKLLQEERPFNAPFFYNGYLIAMLLAASLDPVLVLEGQRRLMSHCRQTGVEALTFILPDTEYVMTATIDELMSNLEWLFYRLKEDEMIGKMTLILESIFEKG